jgi:hypothetical protein
MDRLIDEGKMGITKEVIGDGWRKGMNSYGKYKLIDGGSVTFWSP